jgi:hypothetical protein
VHDKSCTGRGSAITLSVGTGRDLSKEGECHSPLHGRPWTVNLQLTNGTFVPHLKRMERKISFQYYSIKFTVSIETSPIICDVLPSNNAEPNMMLAPSRPDGTGKDHISVLNLKFSGKVTGRSVKFGVN